MLYRQQLKDALERGVPATVHLQEHWAGAAATVMKSCRDKLVAQDGYIGLFGFRYGWIPEEEVAQEPAEQPGNDRISITHMEWRWALEHWSARSEPPIFLFLPETGSEADQNLRRWADEALREEFPDSEDECERSRCLQRNFLEEVRGWAKNRFINIYATERQLREKAITSIYHWNKEIWKQAAQGRGGITHRIPDKELGAIGRDEQVETLEVILAHLRHRADVVAAAFAIHGEQNHGQWHFANFLADWDEWEDGENADDIHPPSRPDRPEDPARLARWACELLQRPVTLHDAMDGLLSTLAERLLNGNVVLILESLGEAADRWSRFVSDFWIPLERRLGEVVKTNHRGRLYWFVLDHEPCPVDCHGIFSPLHDDDVEVDPSLVIPLPQLRSIACEDVSTWIRRKAPTLNGDKIRSERRNEISNAVTQQDGIPVSVFDRLQIRGLWHFDP